MKIADKTNNKENKVKYNLYDPQDEENFINSIKAEAATMLETLPFNEGRDDDAWLQDGDSLAEIAIENFEIIASDNEDEDTVIQVSSMKHAKDLYHLHFARAIREWQQDQMTDYLIEEMTGDAGNGFTFSLTVTPSGQKDGLDYDAVVVDIVGLDADGDNVAYRVSNGYVDQDWQLGSIGEAVKWALDERDDLKGIAEESEFAEVPMGRKRIW